MKTTILQCTNKMVPQNNGHIRTRHYREVVLYSVARKGHWNVSIFGVPFTRGSTVYTNYQDVPYHTCDGSCLVMRRTCFEFCESLLNCTSASCSPSSKHPLVCPCPHTAPTPTDPLPQSTPMPRDLSSLRADRRREKLPFTGCKGRTHYQ